MHEVKVLHDSDTDSLSHWVKLAFITMRRELDSTLRRSGMTLTQWRALGLLLHKPGTTHSELVQQLDIEAPSVTSLVNGMERKGWVRQSRAAADARVKRLFLTASGRRLIEEASEATAPIEDRMAATLSAGERATLKRLLRTMVEGMR
jgi:MarR family transcriptional regulator, transcriptional regulator for hemolysin